MDVISQEYEPEVDISTIEEHPDNPRKGDDRAVNESVQRNGFFGAILVQKSTRHVIAGNTRFRVMRDGGERTVPAFIVDVDDETATRIMLADNRTSDLAFYDDEQLFMLLQQLVDGEGLEGTGYDRAAYELLLQSVESDTIVGNIRHGAAPEERIADYEELDVRSLILPYEGRMFEEVAGNFASLRDFWGMDSNAEVARKLAADAVEALVSA